MAAKFDVPNANGDLFSFDPADIKIPAHLNGRHDLPDIDWLVESILTQGQIQPVRVRKDGSTPVLCLGFSRWRAISAINDLVGGGKKAEKWSELHPGVPLPTVPMKLKCCYVQCSEMDGFIANISENLVRKGTTDLDDVYNVQRLKKWDMTDSAIAAIYKKPESWVRKCAKIAATEPEVLKAVKDGRMKLTAAAAIAKLTSEQQREKVKGDGPVEVKPKIEMEGKRFGVKKIDKLCASQETPEWAACLLKIVSGEWSEDKAEGVEGLEWFVQRWDKV